MQQQNQQYQFPMFYSSSGTILLSFRDMTTRRTNTARRHRPRWYAWRRAKSVIQVQIILSNKVKQSLLQLESVIAFHQCKHHIDMHKADMCTLTELNCDKCYDSSKEGKSHHLNTNASVLI